MRKRGPKPKNTISTIWSANLAYALGLITTDGCLSRDGRHIIFVSKEIEQLQNLAKCLNIKVVHGKTVSGTGVVTYRIQISSQLFYKFLISIGLTPAKSLTLGALKIPDKFFFNFARGCFDGDGCSYSYLDPRWKSSLMFYLCFASGSYSFIHWLSATIERLAGIRGYISISKKREGKNNYYQLRFSKYKALRLITFLYTSDSAPYLTRKRLKIEKTLDTIRRHKGKVFKSTL